MERFSADDNGRPVAGLEDEVEVLANRSTGKQAGRQASRQAGRQAGRQRNATALARR
eukprot:COSAG06_NODE_7144_length_2612_cov_13.528850_3_plen_57_part_00